MKNCWAPLFKNSRLLVLNHVFFSPFFDTHFSGLFFLDTCYRFWGDIFRCGKVFSFPLLFNHLIPRGKCGHTVFSSLRGPLPVLSLASLVRGEGESGLTPPPPPPATKIGRTTTNGPFSAVGSKGSFLGPALVPFFLNPFAFGVSLGQVFTDGKKASPKGHVFECEKLSPKTPLPPLNAFAKFPFQSLFFRVPIKPKLLNFPLFTNWGGDFGPRSWLRMPCDRFLFLISS